MVPPVATGPPWPDRGSATMTRELSARILVGLSILYGITIGVLGALEIAVTPTAVVGAAIVGGLWVVHGLVWRRG